MNGKKQKPKIIETRPSLDLILPRKITNRNIGDHLSFSDPDRAHETIVMFLTDAFQTLHRANDGTREPICRHYDLAPIKGYEGKGVCYRLRFEQRGPYDCPWTNILDREGL